MGLLALLVVGAQQSALLHEIGHGFGQAVPAFVAAVTASDVPGSSQATSKEAASSYCEKCFQFAHVCGAGFSSPVTIAVLAARSPAKRAFEVAELPADPPQSRSRSPPVLL